MSDDPSEAPAGSGTGLDQTLDQELHGQRRAGAFPPGFEQRLDEAYARVTPREARERDTKAALERVEAAVAIDLDVPVASRKPGLEVVKRAIREGVTWYFNYVVIQLREFTIATLRVLHTLDARVKDLEAESAVRRAAPLPGGGPGPRAPDPSVWGWLVDAELAGAPGLVLHGECGTGGLLRHLTERDTDAYGVDPRIRSLGEEPQGSPRAGVDIRSEEVGDHLRSLGERTLGGLVLSGCVDRAALGEKHELAHLAASRLVPGATVIVIGTVPEAWQWPVSSDPAALIDADLAPGRPLHPETWAHLLGLAGLEVTATHLEPARRRLEPVPGEGTSAAAINANLAVLERMLLGPESYAVVGRRPA